jgi:hypothetical protein
MAGGETGSGWEKRDIVAPVSAREQVGVIAAMLLVISSAGSDCFCLYFLGFEVSIAHSEALFCSIQPRRVLSD